MLQQTAGGWFEQCNMCRRVVEELLASSSAVARGSLDEIAEDCGQEPGFDPEHLGSRCFKLVPGRPVVHS